MSEEKREYLKSIGRMDADGNRLDVCVHCGQIIPVGTAIPGSAVAKPDAVKVSATAPKIGSEK